MEKIEGLVITEELKEHLRRGNELFDEEKYEEALESYKSIIEEFPDAYIIHKNIGNCYFQTEKYDLAEGAIYRWEKAVELKPDFSFPLYNLGLVYLAKGDKTQALSYFAKYKEIHYHSLSPEGKDKLDTLIQKCREKT